MKRVITSDAETAGFLQSEIDRQGLSGELKAERHPYAPPGMVIVEGDGGREFFPVEDVTRSYAGVRVLLYASGVGTCGVESVGLSAGTGAGG